MKPMPPEEEIKRLAKADTNRQVSTATKIVDKFEADGMTRGELIHEIAMAIAQEMRHGAERQREILEG